MQGAAVAGIEPGQVWWRLENSGGLAVPTAPFVGSTQHLVYTDAAERRELVRISTGPSGPCAVLIPIRKSAAWWALAQDERQAFLTGGARSGHIPLGRPFASHIYRRLYHSRYLPGSEWDFVTYFEFPESLADTFRDLLSSLRDPAQNPEWTYVERELELWMRLSPEE
ncbi:MAG TPA: chlorite dismutase family protein [Polyangiaceae bacterium]|nr:chlorite dismutase family protein [Polyangiaceae bacterium]